MLAAFRSSGNRSSTTCASERRPVRWHCLAHEKAWHGPAKDSSRLSHAACMCPELASRLRQEIKSIERKAAKDFNSMFKAMGDKQARFFCVYRSTIRLSAQLQASATVIELAHALLPKHIQFHPLFPDVASCFLFRFSAVGVSWQMAHRRRQL